MDLLEQLTAALGDRYRVERELGHGGMAIVFLAEDLKHRRRVAIKLLKPDLSAVLGSERFLREIEIAATLQHPHILPLFDSGAAGGLLYYVMPFAEGESLRQRLAREQQLPLDAALQITREVGSALQYAHEHGVIHRDIKPENVMLSGGEAVVADFGIARALHAASPEQLTSTGIVVGTPHYMSPEQAAGAAVDGRSDQYSLACTLYEMLCGQPPFTGPSSQAIIARHSLEPVPSLRVVRQTVPSAVEGAIMKAMAKVPADRFGSMRQFLDALATPETTSVGPAPPALSQRRFGARASRRLLGALGVGLLVAAAVWWFAAGRSARGAYPGLRVVTAVAVLPFRDPASSPDSSYLADGMTEGLIADLAQIGSLKVISGSSGSVAQGAGRSLAEVGHELGVDAIVKGSIRRAGDSVRVNVRFLYAPDSTLLFVRDYQGRLGELPDLQRQITMAITGSISAKLKGTERSRLDARREVDQRAYEAYLRDVLPGSRRARAGADTVRGSKPNQSRLAPPYVGLANYYTSLPFFADVPPAEVLPRPGRRWSGPSSSTRRWRKRTQPTPTSGPTTSGIGAPEQEFRRALELRPNYADAYFSTAASSLTPPARRGHRTAQPRRGVGPALAPAAGKPRPARLLRGPL